MATIEGIFVKNYRVLKRIEFGKTIYHSVVEPLTSLSAIIGKNGVGKSTLFDVFGFLSDCMEMGVEEASELKTRGGYRRLVSNNEMNKIHLGIRYRESEKTLPINYILTIKLDQDERPYVDSEAIYQIDYIKPFEEQERELDDQYVILELTKGKGAVSFGDSNSSKEDLEIELSDIRQLGISTLGLLKEHPRIVNFRNFIQNWLSFLLHPQRGANTPN